MFELKGGDTALMAAAKNGHEECVSMLIAAGANVHAVTKVMRNETFYFCISNIVPYSSQDNWNAIIYANVDKHEGCVALLTAAGAEVFLLMLLLLKRYA